MSTSLSALLAARKLIVEENVSMAGHTTLKVGGMASMWVEARSAEDVVGAMEAASVAGVPYQVIGNGSNLLVRDGGIEGVVIHIGGQMGDVTMAPGGVLRIEAGAMLSQVAVKAQAAGLSGMEAISGIPGTVGGAVCMNAGSYGLEIGELIDTVEVIDGAGQQQLLKASDLHFGYRTSSIMQQGWTVVAASLVLTPGDAGAISETMRGFAMQRRSKQPLTMPSAGSFFKRPQGQFAASLIDQAGLKGLSVGGAQVSTLHAGFLVNTGGATAKDFIELMAIVQARVLESSGVMLEPEVRILGCDSSY